MPHYKCGACRTRLQIAHPPPAPIVSFCPQCRAALDRVADLSELIGLRRVSPAREPDGAGGYIDAFERDEIGALDEPPATAMAVRLPSPAR